jgi:glycosidase
VGEVLTADADYRARYMKSIGSDFDYSLIYDIIAEIASPKTVNLLADKTYANYRKYRSATSDNYTNAPFLTDADINRLAGKLDNDARKIKLAHAVSYTVEGLPFMYYGDELGMLGNKDSGDIFKLSFPWGDDDPLATTNRRYNNIYNKKTDKSDYTQAFSEQLDDPESILSADRRLIRARKNTEALCAGRYTKFDIGGDAGADVVSYKMISAHQEAVILHNFFGVEKSFTFDAYSDYKLIYLTNRGKLSAVGSKITLQPYESVIFVKRL